MFNECVCDWSMLGYASRLCLWQKCSNSCVCMVCVCFLDATDVNIVFKDEVRKGREEFIKTVNIQACYFDKHKE